MYVSASDNMSRIKENKRQYNSSVL